MKITDSPVIVEQLFKKPVNLVWKAITDLDQMLLWYFDTIPDFKAEVGFTTQFNVKAPSRDFMHLWEVTEVIPNRKIVTNWKYEGFNGNSFVTFELFEQNSQTLLRLTNIVIEDFDDAIPEFRRESCLAGWNYFIKDRLVSFINN